MSPKEASEGFNLQPQPRYSNPQILPIQHEVSYGRVNLNPLSTKMTWPGQGVCKVDSSYRVFIWECKRNFKYNPLKPKTRHFGWAYYRSISQFLIHNRLLNQIEQSIFCYNHVQSEHTWMWSDQIRFVKVHDPQIPELAWLLYIFFWKSCFHHSF